MKNLLLLLTMSFLLVQKSSGQELHFVSEGTRLAYGEGNLVGSDYGFDQHQFLVRGDTSINDLTYQKVDIKKKYRYAYQFETLINEFQLRQDSQQVYLIRDDLDEEILLYDFSLEVMDTFDYLILNPPNPMPSQFEYIVLEVDTFFDYDGLPRKQLLLTNLEFYNLGLGYIQTDTWVEGIGSLNYFPAYFTNLSDTLLCVNYGGLDQVYSFDDYYCQDEFITNVEDLSEEPQVLISPNPVNNILSIDFGITDASYEVKIGDAVGRVIHNIDGAKGEMQIDVSGYRSGIYYLYISDAKGLLSTSKFVVVE